MGRQVRVGLIGTGRWGQVYIRTLATLATRCQLTHVATSKPVPLARLPSSVTVVTDWHHLLDSDCEAVIIATPARTHAELVEACVAAGKPCIVEKPLCLDLSTAESLHEQVTAANVPVLVDHTQLFNPAYVALKHALAGRQETIRLVHSEGMDLGVFRTDSSALWDWCCHDVSLCLDLLGDYPTQVDVLGGPTTDPGGAPEHVTLRLGFPSGACAWIHGGRLSAQKRRNLSVWTDSQVYLFDDLASEKLRVSPCPFAQRYEGGVPDQLEFRTVRVPSLLTPMASMLSYFLDGLAGGDHRYFGTAFALQVVRVLSQCEVRLRATERQIHQGIT